MSAISGAGSSAAAPAAANDAFSAMSSVDFMEIIFTELTNQDPLAPNETKDLLEQVSIIRSIESDLSLSKELKAMVRQNEITSSSSLVGKFVTGLNSSSASVAGFVDSVTITREGIRLNLSSGHSISLDAVEEIIDPDIIAIDDPDAPVDPVDGDDPTDPTPTDGDSGSDADDDQDGSDDPETP
jgi:flagellar basal-body rod modification protein FlgD